MDGRNGRRDPVALPPDRHKAKAVLALIREIFDDVARPCRQVKGA